MNAWGIPIELTRAETSSITPESIPTPTKPPIQVHGRLVRIQQDNAGGHGFNNFKGGRPTEPQRRMVEHMRARGYLVYRQPRNSPEFNMLDLGFWNSIKQAVRQRSGEIRKLCYGVVLGSADFDSYSPMAIFSLPLAVFT